MSVFRDGPARGRVLVFRRAPLFLRVVEDRRTHAFDVLDQLDDEPSRFELIHVYRRVTDPARAHLNTRGCGRGAPPSGFYEFADYEHVPDVDGEEIRDTAAWRLWCEQQAAA